MEKTYEILKVLKAGKNINKCRLMQAIGVDRKEIYGLQEMDSKKIVMIGDEEEIDRMFQQLENS